MDIRAGTDRKPLIDIIFGGNTKKDSSLNTLVAASTFGVLVTIVLFGVLIYISGHTTMVFLHTLVISALIAGLISLAIAILGLIAHDEWNTKYGFGMWLRIVIWGIFLITVSLTTNKIQLSEKIREPVVSFQFIKSDVEDCESKIRMKSKSFNYEYCSSYSSNYDNILHNKKLEAVLIGGIQYGYSKATHVEFIEKNVGVPFE